MNVKIVYASKIDSWDSRADGSATASHAQLRVRGNNLELWSSLRFDEEYDAESGDARKSRTESGSAEGILSIKSDNPPKDFAGWLAAAHDELGLLRLDVDGETVYEYEEPDEGGDESDEKAIGSIPTYSPGSGTLVF